MAFKPYVFKGCMIESPENKEFLELFAGRVKSLTTKEKEQAHRKTIKYGRIKYQFLYQNGKVYLVSGSNRAIGKVYVAEIK